MVMDADAAAIAPALEAVAGRIAGSTVLVGKGQYSGKPGHQRVGLLCVDPGRADLAWDGFLTPGAHEQLLREIGERAATTWQGELDFMHATDWTLAWTSAPAPFRLYARTGLRCAVDAGRVTLAGAPAIDARRVREIAVWLSDDWTDRAVSLVLQDGDPVEIGRARDAMLLIDPCYDGLNLMCDASWAVALAGALASALGVPRVLPEALR